MSLDQFASPISVAGTLIFQSVVNNSQPEIDCKSPC